MNSEVVSPDGVVLEEWNDDTRTYTSRNPDGTVLLTRPYTAEENAAADERATQETQSENKSTIEQNLEADLAAMQAIKDQANSALRTDPSQEIKDIAVAVRRLIRMALEDYSGTE